MHLTTYYLLVMDILYVLSLVMVLFLFTRLLFSWWILPHLVYRKVKSSGFSGPRPSFPYGNLSEMKRLKLQECDANSSLTISNDIHSRTFPYFSHWQNSYGKVFLYWLGTEPFLYVADAGFLKKMSGNIKGKDWGKPNVFKHDRYPMFGNGLLMVESEDWVRHRHVITPAFTPSNLKAMASSMIESATSMLNKWSDLISFGHPEIDVEKEIIDTSGEIIAKTSFGVSYENGKEVLEKLRSMQIALFKSNRYVGVPYGNFMNPKQTLHTKKLGREIDGLLRSIIRERQSNTTTGQDLLGLMLAGNTTESGRIRALTTKELVDECKTFFFGGHETTALALMWTLLLLALHPEWQTQLRDEISEVMGDLGKTIDVTMLAGLKKMGWVMDEVLRLYPPAPNVQRQARHDIEVDNGVTISNRTNIWIDVVSMHHDPEIWGEDVNEFKPQRFKDNIYGGCNQKMGYLPFGFGGRMCIGRNYTKMEYKIVLTLILSRFSFSLSPTYCHTPSIMLSLRPMQGLPIIFHPLPINTVHTPLN